MRISSLMIPFLLLTLGNAAFAVPMQWEPSVGGNGHFYDVITDTADALTARSLAAGQVHDGQTGYLATITSQAELDFVDALNSGNVELWLGATDSAIEGEWRWDQGPEAGQLLSFDAWGFGEPSDTGGEDYMAGWRNGTSTWNDLSGVFSLGYLVEYAAPSVVAVTAPPTLAILFGGLALLLRRRRH